MGCSQAGTGLRRFFAHVGGNPLIDADAGVNDGVSCPKYLPGKNSGSKKAQGLKPGFLLGPSTARLKSCPDTKHQSGDSAKTRAFPRFESIARNGTNVLGNAVLTHPLKPLPMTATSWPSNLLAV
jgi:hypothetical protein